MSIAARSDATNARSRCATASRGAASGGHRQRVETAPHRFDGCSRNDSSFQGASPPSAFGRRGEITGDDQRLESFLNEERIALGESVQHMPEFIAEVDARAEDR